VISDGDFFCDACPRCGHWIQQRNARQSIAFNSAVSHIARNRDWPPGSGKYLPAKTWKQLIFAAWDRSHERRVDAVPAIDGQGLTGQGWDFVFYRRDSRMTLEEIRELIPYVGSLAVELGVTEPEEQF
jgi:hypothetical protein